MLSNLLYSTYQQYRQDVDSLAGWLASTAKAHGLTSDLLSGETVLPQITPGRLKGKARKEAKLTGIKPGPTKYIVAIKDFVPLAYFIADSTNPPILAPPDFLETLDRVMFSQIRFGGQMSPHEIAAPSETESGRHHFLNIIGQVQVALMPKQATSSRNTVKGREELYARFEVFEHTQEILDTTNTGRPSQVAGDDLKYEAQLQNSYENAMSAYAMLLNDLSLIRLAVGKTWERQKKDDYHLASAAITTDTAISLARDLIKEVDPLFKDHGGILAIAEEYFLAYCALKGHSTTSVEGDYNMESTYELSNEVYFTAYQVLASFLAVLTPGELPLDLENTLGVYDPASDRDAKSNREKFREDKVLLWSFLVEVMALIRMVNNYPVEDEFQRGMKEMERTRQIPFHLVFASQMFLDMHHTLRDKADSSVNHLVREAGKMGIYIKRHYSTHERLKVDLWPASSDRVLQDIQSRIRWIIRDPVWTAKVKRARSMRTPIPPSHNKSLILRYSPVIAGLILYRLRTETYDIGMSIANAWGSIVYCSHLHNVLYQEDLVRYWGDLAVAETLIGVDKLYVGSRPTTLKDCLNSFCLRIGVSVAAFSKTRNRNAPLEFRTAQLGAKDALQVYSMFKERYISESRQTDWKPEHIATLLSRIELMEHTKEGETSSSPQQEDTRRKKPTEGVQFLSATMIEILAITLRKETAEHVFPVLFFHQWCWGLLFEVKQSCNAILRELYPRGHLGGVQLGHIVGWIIVAAATDGDLRPLQTAALAVNKFLSTGRGILSTTMSGLVTKKEAEEEE